MLESHFNKASDLKSCNFIEKRPQHFPLKFAKFLRTPFFYRTRLVAVCEFDPDVTHERDTNVAQKFSFPICFSLQTDYPQFQ